MSEIIGGRLGQFHRDAPMLGEVARGGFPRYPAWKCHVDFALALLILVPAIPVMLAAMAIVRLTSPGPAIYSQARLGLGGRPFTIYKIRTMAHDCERLTGPRWSPARDSRVTPVGRFLRLTHLDELPQLWNVLRGEMSLVGPRPERPEIAAQLEKAIPEYGERVSIRPGLTGLAQVQLPPDVDVEGVRRKLECDLEYIHRCSPLLDLQILLSTATGVLGIPFGLSRVLWRTPRLESWDVRCSPPGGAIATEIGAA